MNSPLLSVTRRTRSTPFTRKVTEAGVKAYTVYNRMLLPTMFESFVDDYHHLKQHVQVWDVSCERQVEIKGRDAGELIQKLTPRSLEKMQDEQCYYLPMVDENGGMLNDPVALKHSNQHYWISLADSDLLLWVKGLVVGLGMDVTVDEPDVYPLAVQGPMAENLMVDVFGGEIKKLKFFRFKRFIFKGHNLIIARSGYSKQGGFEIYVEGTPEENLLAETLWDALMEAGVPYQVRAGGPNYIERMEGGLLSYGNDMTRDNTPYECGLGKFCDREIMKHSIGGSALARRYDHTVREGTQQEIRGFKIVGESIPPCLATWSVQLPNTPDHAKIGQITSACWSPDFNTNLAIGMIHQSTWEPGTEVEVLINNEDSARKAVVANLPFTK